MHPEITRRLIAQRREELTRGMAMTRGTTTARRAGLGRGAGLGHDRGMGGPAGELPRAGRAGTTRRMAAPHRRWRLPWAPLSRRVPSAGASGRRRGREVAPGPRAVRGPQWPGTLPGVFSDGPEAIAVRAYLTPDEARQLMAEGSELFARFADRLDDPRRRPAGAKPFEVVVLGRRLRDPAAAAGGRDAPGPAD